jgi:hypothetical protein
MPYGAVAEHIGARLGEDGALIGEHVVPLPRSARGTLADQGAKSRRMSDVIAADLVALHLKATGRQSASSSWASVRCKQRVG